MDEDILESRIRIAEASIRAAADLIREHNGFADKRAADAALIAGVIYDAMIKRVEGK